MPRNDQAVLRILVVLMNAEHALVLRAEDRLRTRSYRLVALGSIASQAQNCVYPQLAVTASERPASACLRAFLGTRRRKAVTAKVTTSSRPNFPTQTSARLFFCCSGQDRSAIASRYQTLGCRQGNRAFDTRLVGAAQPGLQLIPNRVDRYWLTAGRQQLQKLLDDHVGGHSAPRGADSIEPKSYVKWRNSFLTFIKGCMHRKPTLSIVRAGPA